MANKSKWTPWCNVDAKRGPKKSIWIGESKERDDIYPGKDGKPVPSRYGPDRVYVANFLAGYHVCEEQAAANASRAVQCVNACAGIADPASTINAMRDALKAIVAHDKNGRFGTPSFSEAIEQARAALTRAKEIQP